VPAYPGRPGKEAVKQVLCSSGSSLNFKFLLTPSDCLCLGFKPSAQPPGCCECIYIVCIYQTTTLHPFNGLFSRTAWVSWYQKGKTSLDLNEERDDAVWGCNGIRLTNANNLHLAPDRYPHGHTNTSSLNFCRPHALPDAQPAVSKHWRQLCIYQTE